MREELLNALVHRLRLIESYGTGIRKIYALYKYCAMQRRIEVTTNTFKLVLPNMNASGVIAENELKTGKKALAVVTPQMKKVVDYLAEYGEMIDADFPTL